VPSKKKPLRLKIEYVDPKTLKPWPENPRIIRKTQKAALAKSVDKFGMVDPIIVRGKDDLVVGGHQRLIDALEKGTKRVPIVRIDVKNEKDLKALNLALNQISGDWNEEKLVPIFQDLKIDYDMTVTGFTEADMTQILRSQIPLEALRQQDEDCVPTDAEAAQAPLGTRWRLGDHILLRGDATKSADWELLLQGEKVQCYVTDPPYGVDFAAKSVKDRSQGGLRWRFRQPMQADMSLNAALEAMPHLVSNFSETGAGYLFCGTDLLVDAVVWLRDNNVRYPSFIVWVKTQFVPSWERYHAAHENIVFFGPGARGTGTDKGWFGPKNETTIWEHSADSGDDVNRLHPTQKPVVVYERALLNSSAPGDVVCDPFLGSGTMLIAAEKQKRRAFVMEIEPKFCGIAIARWERFTQKKAIETRL
jgi:DNA modification methylase